MSDAADKKIADLEKEKLAAQQMLMLVLATVGEPVEVDMNDAREYMTKDMAIDARLTPDESMWVFQVVEVPK